MAFLAVFAGSTIWSEVLFLVAFCLLVGRTNFFCLPQARQEAGWPMLALFQSHSRRAHIMASLSLIPSFERFFSHIRVVGFSIFHAKAVAFDQGVPVALYRCRCAAEVERRSQRKLLRSASLKATAPLFFERVRIYFFVDHKLVWKISWVWSLN